MKNSPVRPYKLVTNPKGQLYRIHRGQTPPEGWIVLEDPTLYYRDELLAVFKSLPLVESKSKNDIGRFFIDE